MYYSYVEIEYVATSFSPARTDLALKLLSNHIRSYIGLSKGHVAQPYYVKVHNHGCGRNHNATINYEVPQIGNENLDG
jgi:hypothetical protein